MSKQTKIVYRLDGRLKPTGALVLVTWSRGDVCQPAVRTWTMHWHLLRHCYMTLQKPEELVKTVFIGCCWGMITLWEWRGK